MVIFNQQGWEKQETQEGIDKDEGRKYKSHPPIQLHPVRKSRSGGGPRERFISKRGEQGA